MTRLLRTTARRHRAPEPGRFPEFQPHPLLANPHAQTLAGVYLPAKKLRYRATQWRVQLPDGDQLVLHDDMPHRWRPGDRVALLVHGLGGCFRSGYMARIAAKLNNAGLRTFRLDMRGWGAGFALARLPFHGGRSADIAAAAGALSRLCPTSPQTLIGFSLGASMLLKLLGEGALEATAAGAPQAVDSAVAVCPPLDLLKCSRRISEPQNRMYNRHFLAVLTSQLARHCREGRGGGSLKLARRPRTVYEFDDLFTGPACGFGSAENYYAQASAGQFLPRIKLRCLVLKAADDPLVDHQDPRELALPTCIEWQTTKAGGHLGFIARPGLLPDRRWMDWRVVDWVTRRDRQAA